MGDAVETTGTETPTTDTTATTGADGAAAPAVETSADPLAALDGDTVLGGGEGGEDEKPADAKSEGKEGKAEGEADKAPEGAPEAYDLKAPEGQQFDKAAFDMVEPVLRELNLPNEAAQKLVDIYAGKVMPHLQQAAQQRLLSEVVEQRKGWAEEFAKDAEIGGAKAEETKALAAKGLDALGFTKGSSFRNLLDDSGLGNHPDMIRAWRKVGELVGEDGFSRSDPAAGAKVPLEDRIYGKPQAS